MSTISRNGSENENPRHPLDDLRGGIPRGNGMIFVLKVRKTSGQAQDKPRRDALLLNHPTVFCHTGRGFSGHRSPIVFLHSTAARACGDGVVRFWLHHAALLHRLHRHLRLIRVPSSFQDSNRRRNGSRTTASFEA